MYIIFSAIISAFGSHLLFLVLGFDVTQCCLKLFNLDWASLAGLNWVYLTIPKLVVRWKFIYIGPSLPGTNSELGSGYSYYWLVCLSIVELIVP